MSVKALTRTDNLGGKNCLSAVWALANGDTGAPIEAGDYADASVQVTGTFGAGGSVTFEGSNDGTNFVALKDPYGNALTLTSAGLVILQSNVKHRRPNCTAGDGTTALTITLWSRRSR